LVLVSCQAICAVCTIGTINLETPTVKRNVVLVVPLAYFGPMEIEPLDVRLPVMVSRSAADAIDNWRYANHIPTRAEAIRRLIEMGLEAAKAELGRPS
jgi:hypothetical protein